MNTIDTAATAAATPVTDASGYRIFSEGELGDAHATAHQMLDLGWPELGYTLLSQALEGRDGRGSQWVHIQWHLMVFELETGRIDDALERLAEHILPAASEAPTDGPQALWRVRLATEDSVDLPWRSIWRDAVDRLWSRGDHYATAHRLLAIAGTGDLSTLDFWLTCEAIDTRRPPVLQTLAIGLRSYAAGDFELAAAALGEALPGLPSLGGSRAQNQLFERIHQDAQTRPDNPDNPDNHDNHEPGLEHPLAVN